jgi:DNA modification methylase
MPGPVIEPYLADPDVTLFCGDALEVALELDDDSVGCVVTSPPYRDLRPEYPDVDPRAWPALFAELARVVTGGMLWNVGRRWRERVESLWWVELVDAARAAGWEHRDTLLWIKANPNPIQGEVLTNAHEYVLAFGRRKTEDDFVEQRIAYAAGSIARLRRRHLSHLGVKGDLTPGFPSRSRRQIEEAGTRRHEPHPNGARAPGYFVASVGKAKGNKHPAPMPLELALALVDLLHGAPVLDPFAGSGTTLVAARLAGRPAVGIELDSDYCALAAERLAQQGIFA